MTYIYGGTTESNINNIKNTNGIIDEVSPSYFDIDEYGNLIITDYLDITYINEMHNMGVKVVPFLSNHWNRNIGRAGLNNYMSLANQIVNAIYKYNLDGVNIDIENVIFHGQAYMRYNTLMMEYYYLLTEKIDL
jgi:spore germination protein YaaH